MVGNYSCRNDFNLWNKNISGFDCTSINVLKARFHKLASNQEVDELLLKIIRFHLLYHIFLSQTSPFRPIGADSQYFHMGSILSSQLVTCWGAWFSSPNQPAIVIGREKKLIISILDFIKIKRLLMSDRIRMADRGMTSQR